VNDDQELELIYVGDPMCSWCWGFSPTLAGLEKRINIPIRTVVGGLSPGEAAHAVDDALVEMLEHHWGHVEEASGQPFDRAILARRGWRYDTELPCSAVVAVREQNPALTLRFFERLHRAFYAEGIDITEAAPYRELAADFVPDVDAFLQELGSERLRKLTWQDFAVSRQLGVSGFPTLLLRRGHDIFMITRGWAPLDAIESALRSWLQEQLGEQAAGKICEIGGAC